MHLIWGFPDGSDSKESACNVGDAGLIPASGRSLGGGHGNPPQYSCLHNPMDRGAWWNMVHRVAKSQLWLKRLSTCTLYKWSHIVFVLLCRLISLNVTSSMFIHVEEGDCNSLLFFFLINYFLRWKIFQCMCIPHFVYTFICWFHLLAVIVNSVAVNMGVQISLWYPVFHFWCMLYWLCQSLWLCGSQ